MSGDAGQKPRRARTEVSLKAKGRLYELHDEHGDSWTLQQYAEQLYKEELVDSQPTPDAIRKMLKPNIRKRNEDNLLKQNDSRNSLKRQRTSPVENLNNALCTLPHPGLQFATGAHKKTLGSVNVVAAVVDGVVGAHPRTTE